MEYALKWGPGGISLKHPLNVNAAPPPPPRMTEREGQCSRGSPLCEATVVIGSEQGYATTDSPGIPRLYFRIFFFFYLLRCCSSSQNKSFIAISSWPCTRTPSALIELSASGIINNPKSPSSTSLSFFVFEGGYSAPVTLPPPPATSFHWVFNLQSGSGSGLQHWRCCGGCSCTEGGR